MYYNLNHNYGKVAVYKAKQERVAVYSHGGKLAHCLYCGEVDIAFVGNGLMTSFFGAAGYKVNSDDSWTFCNGMLVALVIHNDCYVVTQDDKPIDCVEGHTLYEKLQNVIATGEKKPKNNVFTIRPK
jgi:hypothetical protein